MVKQKSFLPSLEDLSFRRIGAVYVWLIIIVVFCILSPDIFMTKGTVTAIANNYAISGIAAIAILLPLVTGIFDVSIGGNISLSSVICASLLIHLHWPIAIVLLCTLGVGATIGLVNSFVVVVLRIPSLIGTLAVAGIADALSIAFSGNQSISSPALIGAFGNAFSQLQLGGFSISVLYLLVLVIIVDVVLRQTATGRYSYAVGFDPEVSRLAGVRVRGLQVWTLVLSGVLGAFAGVILTAHVASASPNSGDTYLLPAFAAVFVGATQFKAKRFNALGTLIAVYMLGTGQYGLVIAGAPTWTPNLFQGVALIAAIGLTHLGSSRQADNQSFFRLNKLTKFRLSISSGKKSDQISTVSEVHNRDGSSIAHD